ncbi:MAG: hypothetical protein IJN20_02155 [Oscillospiraceae bacterium]|nr:hypothetical protein [Oscillospiraceae bacterium]
MKQIGHFLTFLASLLIRVLAAVLAGVLLLTLVYCIPTEPIEQNLALSAEVFAAEGVMPELFPWCTSFLDNFTDAIILSNAAHSGTDSAIIQAMTAARNQIDGLDPATSIAAHYIEGIPFNQEVPYYQYWHGYLLLVKPLLFLTSYQNIRIINAIAQFALLVVLVYLMYRKGLKAYIIPYLLGIAFLMPVVMALSLQFAPCYYIMTIGGIVVLLAKERLDSADCVLFLYLGIATSYFDFLTYPMATLGVPAVFYFLLHKTSPIRETFQRGFRICFSWGFGYVTMWAGKWIVGSLVTGTNVLLKASDKIAERSSANISINENLLLNMYAAVSVNVKYFIQTPAMLLLCVFLLIVLIYLIRQWKNVHIAPVYITQTTFPFFVLAIMPVVWYMATTNHSTIHYWFTGKALIVSVFSASCALIRLYQDTSKKQ